MPMPINCGHRFLATVIATLLLLTTDSKIHSNSIFCMAMASSSTTSSATTAFRRGLVPTPLGLVHYTAVGGSSGGAQTTKTKTNSNAKSLLPIIGFHMSPRSVDEYKEIMMECCVGDNNDNQEDGEGRLFVAMDEFGYGQSDNPSQTCTLDEISDCFLAVLDHLKIDKCIVTGSLMGCYMALSLASRYPDRIKGVVCTNLYYFQAKAREKALLEESDRLSSPTDPWRNAATPDAWELQGDGSHVNEIFGKRASWLSTELNTRATLDNLNYLVKRRERYANGVHIQDGGAFLLQETCARVTCPVLCINGAAAVGFFDMIGMEMTKQFDEVLEFFPDKPETIILEPPGSSINMMNENAKEWYGKVSAFAKRIES